MVLYYINMHTKLVIYASSVQKKKSHLINLFYQHAMIKLLKAIRLCVLLDSLPTKFG
jgi:hypothetical protein